VIRYALLILMGVLSAPLMELLSMLWLKLMPTSADLTANYFTAVALPVALFLHFAMALILWKAFEPAPIPSGAAYLTAHLIAQGILLKVFFNPAADIAAFLAVLLASGCLMIFVFNRYFWCPQCAGPV
jgi:hypothetical protein